MPRAPPGGPPARFDPDVLRDWGLGPSVESYFREGTRFPPGRQWVSFVVNGDELGRRDAAFDAAGRLCFTPALVESLGLRPLARQADCPDYSDDVPGMLLALRPGEGAVELTVPPDRLLPDAQAPRIETGGVGAMLNYRGFAYDSRVAGRSGHGSRDLDTELGFNAGDWIARSRQSLGESDGARYFRWQSAYAQKTFADRRQVLQVGRLATLQPLFAGLPLTGVQWFPERALRQARGYPVTGVASTRSRLEIRQNDLLLFSTVVPPGPFTLSDYPLDNRSADLQVRVIGETGEDRVFTVPAASLLLAADHTQNEGPSAAAGWLWNPSASTSASDAAAPGRVPVATLAHGWAWGPFGGTVGGALSGRLASVGAAASWKPVAEAGFFAQGVAARDAGRGVHGAQGSAAMTWQAGEALSLGISGNLRTAGYRGPQDAARGDPAPAVAAAGVRAQVGAMVSWRLDRWGSAVFGITRESRFDGTAGHLGTLAWNVAWGPASLQAGLSRNAMAAVREGGVRRPSGTAAYLNLSVAWEAGSTGTAYARRDDGGTRHGLAVDRRVGDTASLRLAAERRGDGAGAEASASATVLPRYASLSLGLVDQREAGRSRYGELSGSVMATPAGIGFSPYPVQDTFASLRTGDVVGLRVETPQGPVWSGPGGIAAVPGLPAYQPSRLEANLKDAALEVDVERPLQVVQAGRGAVLAVDVGARRVRRVVLAVVDARGMPLPSGLPVLMGGTGEHVAFTALDGWVVANDLRDDEALVVDLGDGGRCTLREIRVRPRAAGEPFQGATAVCR